MIVGLMSNQQTFIDMTDSQNLSISIAYNLPVVQVKNNSENPATYSPSWETTNLILTPTVFLNSADVTTSIESITWKRQDGGATPVNLISGETVSNGILTVSTNNLSTSSSGIITYICTATTADGLTATEKVSFSLIVSGATSTSENASVTFQLYAPNGYVLSNTIESITLQTVAYVGSTQIQTGEATYRWYEQNDAEWSLIQEGTSSSYIVTRDDVNKFKNYKCDMIYNGNTYTATIMVEDKSDTYNIVICISSNINIFTPIENIKFSFIILLVFLEICIASIIFFNSSVIITISDASIAEFDPIPPIDIPISALAKTGLSLIPSPTYATFFSVILLSNTFSNSLYLSCGSISDFTSSMFTSFAIRVATSFLSPVSIFVFIPNSFNCLIVSLASDFISSVNTMPPVISSSIFK